MPFKFQIHCLDCNHSEQSELQAKTFFNKDGDHIGNFVNELNFCNRISVPNVKVLFILS